MQPFANAMHAKDFVSARSVPPAKHQTSDAETDDLQPEAYVSMIRVKKQKEKQILQSDHSGDM